MNLITKCLIEEDKEMLSEKKRESNSQTAKFYKKYGIDYVKYFYDKYISIKSLPDENHPMYKNGRN